MTKSKLAMSAAAALALTGLTACGWVKSQFPDKGKDYYYSSEIPPLYVPPELSNNSIDTQAGVVESGASVQSPGTPQVVVDQVKLVQPTGGAARIQLNEPFDRAWRIVGKALSRQALEITDRNFEDGVYFVQYDPNAHALEDGSIWDELVFFFGEDQNQEKEYRVRLAAKQQFTEVIVTDENDVPLSDGPGLKLLKSIFKAIQADYADN